MEPSSLLDMTIKAVFNNVEKYDKHLLKTIIAPVRQRMLKRMFEMEENHNFECDRKENHFEKLWAILPFLINSKKYTKLDTLDLPSMYCGPSTLINSRFQEFIRCLEANTPNLRELRITRPTNNEEYSLEERELNSIIQLRNLAILKIIYVCVPLSGILAISHRCENLKTLEAFAVTNDVESSRVTFRNDFVHVSIDGHSIKHGMFRLMMNTTMPSLDPKFAESKQYTKMILSPNKTSDFGLVHLFAEKLTKIRIFSPDLDDVEEIVDFPPLPQIKSASIQFCGKMMHAIRSFMKSGKTLQKLTLSSIRTKEMTFGKIFSLCPNLQSLQLYYCNFFGNDATVDAMHKLKRFTWHSIEQDPSVWFAFSSVLSAPLLERVEIDLPNIDFSDNAKVIAQIERREILRNLKNFQIGRAWLNSEEKNEGNFSIYLNSYTEFKNAIENAISA
ncbi:Hypothetical predicted protein [Cloeon dipterum]|uniref:F-box domain-containing protein n=1 Tax=Cloeon dipterum TaxID=197152 RepID=A0A8S1DKG3_9INSE|nr:Hypothetical predicted protein [Cloeon dipterum]